MSNFGVCKSCRGVGWDISDTSKDCPECGGKGHVCLTCINIARVKHIVADLIMICQEADFDVTDVGELKAYRELAAEATSSGESYLDFYNDFPGDDHPPEAVTGFQVLFTTKFKFKPQSLDVYVNGLLQSKLGIYVEDGTMQGYTFLVAPSVGYRVQHRYRKENKNASIRKSVEDGRGDVGRAST